MALYIGFAAIGIAAMLLLLLSSTSGGLRTRVASVLASALFGSLGGGAYVMLRRQHRQGAIYRGSSSSALLAAQFECGHCAGCDVPEFLCALILQAYLDCFRLQSILQSQFYSFSSTISILQSQFYIFNPDLRCPIIRYRLQ